ncbi:hypothetical protein HK098_007221 [Nowakowskiella sp. JEL0407]|nr:hypothetical protein HK098_007221 [Nowakowskiella sp. JEL0407]
MASCHRMPFTYGVSSDIGRRAQQQDDFLIRDAFFGLPDCQLFAVFDGHGSEGAKVSAFVKKTLPEILLPLKESFIREPVTTLKSVFATLNEKLNDTPAIDTYMSGTTAVLVLIIARKMVVCGLGDSKVVMGRQGSLGVEPIQLTTDHNCTNKVEFERVIACGARVDKMDPSGDGPLRIYKGSMPYPGLVVTRSLGDTVATKLGVLCEPDIKILDIIPNDKFLILATDGVWDGLSLKEVVNIISKESDPTKASEMITKHSLEGMDKNNIDDNTTNIVVFLDSR